MKTAAPASKRPAVKKCCSRCLKLLNPKEQAFKVGERLGEYCDSCQRELGLGTYCYYDVEIGRGHSPKKKGRPIKCRGIPVNFSMAFLS